MAESGAQPGNQNAVKNKKWREAIQRAVARAANGDLSAGLDQAADKLVKLAMDGERWAVEELGNRVDGKPHQTSDITVEAGSGLLTALAGIGKSDNPKVA